MDWPSNITRAEKERNVIELLKQHKRTREIAERAHEKDTMSKLNEKKDI
jgi:hypothetical protein